MLLLVDSFGYIQFDSSIGIIVCYFISGWLSSMGWVATNWPPPEDVKYKYRVYRINYLFWCLMYPYMFCSIASSFSSCDLPFTNHCRGALFHSTTLISILMYRCPIWFWCSNSQPPDPHNRTLMCLVFPVCSDRWWWQPLCDINVYVFYDIIGLINSGYSRTADMTHSCHVSINCHFILTEFMF